MSKSIILISLLLLSFIAGAKSYPIRWKVKECKVDGNVHDWNRSVSYYDAASKLRYGMRNDSANLYLAFVVSDPLMQMKVSSAGMSFKFKYKNEAKLKPDVFIQPFLKKGVRRGPQSQKPSLDDKRAAYLLNKPPVDLQGFSSCNGKIYSMQHDKKITYALDWDTTGSIVMEMKIPFTELFGSNADFTSISLTDMVVSIQMKAIERPDGAQGGGMGAGGGHGGGGGGRYSGGGMQPSSQPSQGAVMKLFETQFFKKKISFALKPE